MDMNIKYVTLTVILCLSIIIILSNISYSQIIRPKVLFLFLVDKDDKFIKQYEKFRREIYPTFKKILYYEYDFDVYPDSYDKDTAIKNKPDDNTITIYDLKDYLNLDYEKLKNNLPLFKSKVMELAKLYKLNNLFIVNLTKIDSNFVLSIHRFKFDEQTFTITDNEYVENRFDNIIDFNEYYKTAGKRSNQQIDLFINKLNSLFSYISPYKSISSTRGGYSVSIKEQIFSEGKVKINVVGPPRSKRLEIFLRRKKEGESDITTGELNWVSLNEYILGKVEAPTIGINKEPWIKSIDEDTKEQIKKYENNTSNLNVLNITMELKEGEYQIYALAQADKHQRSFSSDKVNFTVIEYDTTYPTPEFVNGDPSIFKSSNIRNAEPFVFLCGVKRYEEHANKNNYTSLNYCKNDIMLIFRIFNRCLNISTKEISTLPKIFNEKGELIDSKDNVSTQNNLRFSSFISNNSTDSCVTEPQFRNSIKKFLDTAKTNPKRPAIIYYSGHGHVDGSLVLSDFNPEENIDKDNDDKISPKELYDILKPNIIDIGDGKKKFINDTIMIFDSCHSGRIHEVFKENNVVNVIILASSLATDISKEFKYTDSYRNKKAKNSVNDVNYSRIDFYNNVLGLDISKNLDRLDNESSKKYGSQQFLLSIEGNGYFTHLIGRFFCEYGFSENAFEKGKTFQDIYSWLDGISQIFYTERIVKLEITFRNKRLAKIEFLKKLFKEKDKSDADIAINTEDELNNKIEELNREMTDKYELYLNAVPKNMFSYHPRTGLNFNRPVNEYLYTRGPLNLIVSYRLNYFLFFPINTSKGWTRDLFDFNVKGFNDHTKEPSIGSFSFDLYFENFYRGYFQLQFGVRFAYMYFLSTDYPATNQYTYFRNIPIGLMIGHYFESPVDSLPFINLQTDFTIGPCLSIIKKEHIIYTYLNEASKYQLTLYMALKGSVEFVIVNNFSIGLTMGYHYIGNKNTPFSGAEVGLSFVYRNDE